MGITHSKVSAIPDGPDSSLVLPSDWNDDHIITGVMIPTVGTSFPDPADNPYCWRTDILGGTLFYHDGTRWLSHVRFHCGLANVETPVNSFTKYTAIDSYDLSIYITRLNALMFGSGFSNPATQYYVLACYRIATGGAETLLGQITNQTIAVNSTWQRPTAVDINTVVSVTNVIGLRWDFTKIGGPNLGYVSGDITYQLVGP